MNEKPSKLKTALRDLAGGAAIGGAIGLVAAVRELARRRRPEAQPGAETSRDGVDLAAAAAGEPAEQGGELPPVKRAPRPGWQPVEREPLPRPTYWPAALAFAIVLLAWGIASTYIISVVGAILLAVSLAGWIGELLHDH